MHTEQDDSKYSDVESTCTPPAVSCASKPAKAKANPPQRVSPRSGQGRQAAVAVAAAIMLTEPVSTLRDFQHVLTLALAEQGLDNCPVAAAMIRSFSASSGISKVEAQCFNTASISCSAVKDGICKLMQLQSEHWTRLQRAYLPRCTPWKLPIIRAYL